eukprot:Tbor_TRINITY_DN5513_c0_g1::TRINITY_DN5513_c0_g1_i1::g.12603::m.12603
MVNTGDSQTDIVDSLLNNFIINDVGRLSVASDTKRGHILLNAESVKIKGDTVVIGPYRIRHRSNGFTAAFIEDRIVSYHDIPKGGEITININLMTFSTTPFKDEDGKECCGFKGLSEDEQDEHMLLVANEVRASAVANGIAIKSSSPLVVVRANGEMGQATFAASAIAKDTCFFKTTGLILQFATVYTIFLGEGKHLLFAGGAQCLAHSCDPNVRIVVDPKNECFEVVALRDIAAGELVAFNYLTTEWDMSSSFPCICGAYHCFRMIRGFKHLTPEQKSMHSGIVSDSVLELSKTGVLKLPPSLVMDGSSIRAKEAVKTSSTLFECTQFTLHPKHIDLFGAIIHHSSDANTVLVEGFLVAGRDIEEHEELTVNMNFFLYDMVALFPKTHDSECRGFKYLEESVKQAKLYLCEPPVRAAAMRDGWIVVSTNKSIVFRPNGPMGQTAYAACDIPADTTLYHATGLMVSYPTMYTICVGEKQHLLFGNGAECIAHHCDPNVRIVVQSDGTFDMVTVRAAKAGEMMTFNYNTTEWDINSPFPCLCGSPLCGNMIRGFRYLPEADRKRLWPLTSEYIKGLSMSESH